MNRRKRIARTFECRAYGESLAWIGRDGNIHYVKRGETHSDWATERAKPIDGRPNYHADEDLLDDGWIRISNLAIWQYYNPSPQAAQTAVQWMTHCAIENHLDLENTHIWVERHNGSVDVVSPADFVKALGGRQAENELFREFASARAPAALHLATIRLAHTLPELRRHLVPLLRKSATRYGYHGTRKAVLDRIRQRGLVPGAASAFGDEYSEYDDGQHVFISDDPEYLRGAYGDTLLRFPWPADAKPDKNRYGRLLGHQFVSRHPIPPQAIEVESSHGWEPLVQ